MTAAAVTEETAPDPEPLPDTERDHRRSTRLPWIEEAGEGGRDPDEEGGGYRNTPVPGSSDPPPVL